MRRDIDSQPIAALMLAATILACSAATTSAQTGASSGQLLELARDEDVQAELGLTDEQIQQIEQAATESRDRSGLSDLYRRSREAKTDEERAAIREEMQQSLQRRQQQLDERLKSVLSSQQLTRLQQLAAEDGADNPGDRPAETGAASSTTTGGSGDAAASSRPAFDTNVPEGAETVASFGRAETETPAAEGEAAASGEREEPRVSFNFRYAPWDFVLQRFAEVAGLTLDLRDVPPGTFNHYDQNEYTITEALDVLNSYLLRRGYVLVKGDGFLVSLNIDDGIPPNLVPTIDASELYDRGRYELLTVVFPLPGANVTEVAAEVEKLKGPQGTVVGMTATNSLIVTDTGINLRRIQKLVANMAPGSEDMVFRPYTLTNIAAEEAELLIKQMLGVSTGVTNVSSSSSRSSGDRDSRSRSDWFRSRSRDDDRDRDSRNTQPTAAVNLSRARIVADPRTNRLLATASPSEHRIIEEAVKTIDVEATGSFLSKKPYLFTYAVRNADSREVTKTIDAIMPGVVVNEDGRNDLIHIMATPEQHEKVRDLIQRMDGAGGGSQVAVIPLSNMDPSQAVFTLQGMFVRDGADAPTIQADLVGRQVMVRGTEDQIVQVRQLLSDLGEDGTGTARAGRGPLRTFNLSGRDPAEILPIIEQMWKMRTGRTINVVNPPGQFRNGPRVLDGDPEVGQEPPLESAPPVNQGAPGETQERLGADRGPGPDPFAVSVESEAADTATEDDAAQAPSASERRQLFTAVEETPAPIDVQITGGDLLLFSQDEQALNEFERMLETVLQRFPPRTTWTVIPLRSADATETAVMLGKLFPDSSVTQGSASSSGLLGTLTSGVTSFGSSVGEMTGLNSLGTGPQTLHIIPEVRLNALFVAGPNYRIEEVRQMLEVLDASGLTDSLRDRVPRMIPVRYAEISEVYEIVKSVYEPEMRSQNNGGNPAAGFAALLSGGRSRRGDGDRENGAPGEPKVTLGVDRITSNLIVSADESTFLEIEQLVQSIDGAARDARRTVQVLSLQNVNSSMVRDSLTSLMPKVTVSTTSSTPRSSTDSSSRSRDSSSSDADEFRQRIEMFRRMREGSGSSDSNSSGDRSSRSGDRGDSPFGGRSFGRGGGGFPFGGWGGRDRGRSDRGR